MACYGVIHPFLLCALSHSYEGTIFIQHNKTPKKKKQVVYQTIKQLYIICYIDLMLEY